MKTRRMFFGLMFLLLGIFAVIDGCTDAPIPDLWQVFGICSLLSMGASLILVKPEQ